MKQIIGPLMAVAGGSLFGLFVPGHYNGHAISLIGWIIAGAAAVAVIIMVAFAVRQQNIDRQVSTSLLASNRTRVFMNEKHDPFLSGEERVR